MHIPASIFLLAGTFLACLPTGFAIWDIIRCIGQVNRIGHSRDCREALDLIPYGPYFDPANAGDVGRPSKIFDLHMGYPWLNRSHISIPAAFRSQSCLILVKRGRHPHLVPANPRAPARAADAMYLYVWPKIRGLVPLISQQCPIDRSLMGYTNTRMKVEANEVLGDLYAEYLIMVMATPSNVVGYGGQQELDGSNTLYTVYDSDGAVDG